MDGVFHARKKKPKRREEERFIFVHVYVYMCKKMFIFPLLSCSHPSPDCYFHFLDEKVTLADNVRFVQDQLPLHIGANNNDGGDDVPRFFDFDEPTSRAVLQYLQTR